MSLISNVNVAGGEIFGFDSAWEETLRQLYESKGNAEKKIIQLEREIRRLKFEKVQEAENMKQMESEKLQAKTIIQRLEKQLEEQVNLTKKVQEELMQEKKKSTEMIQSLSLKNSQLLDQLSSKAIPTSSLDFNLNFPKSTENFPREKESISKLQGEMAALRLTMEQKDEQLQKMALEVQALKSLQDEFNPPRSLRTSNFFEDNSSVTSSEITERGSDQFQDSFRLHQSSNSKYYEHFEIFVNLVCSGESAIAEPPLGFARKTDDKFYQKHLQNLQKLINKIERRNWNGEEKKNLSAIFGDFSVFAFPTKDCG